MAYVNVRKLREEGIILSAFHYKVNEFLPDLPKKVRRRAKCIMTYLDSIIDAIAEQVPAERRQSLKRNINNYQVQVIPATQRAQTPEEATCWVIDADGVAALIALDPDECALCDRWTPEEQRSCPRRKVLNALDITIKCDNAFDEPLGCQWVDE